MIGVDPAQIHRYPARPEGFSEPLFLTAAHRKEIAEHLAASGWLWKASEAGSGGTCEQEPVEVVSYRRCVEVRRQFRRPRGGWVRRRVSAVVERWREVDRWWAGEDHPDRYVFRVSLEGEAVVDLAMDRASRGWSLIGVVD